jgi:hypothetical protein
MQDAGIPPTLVTDNANEETHGEWAQTCRVCHVQQKHTAPCSPWQNLAKETRHPTANDHQKYFLCHCGQWVAAVRSLTALDLPQLDGQTPESHMLS